jgi:hypothetical protein
MLRLTRLLVVGLLALPAGSCSAVSSYLAGMDDNPENYTWAPVEQAVEGTTRPRQKNGEPVEETAHQKKGEPVEGTAHQKKPEPVEQTTQKNWQQDLRDCEAPGAQAGSGDTGASTGAPTIARSENAPLVARCMADKGYRKVYQARIDLF